MNMDLSTRRRVDVLSAYQQKLSSLFRANGYKELRSELLETASIQMTRNPDTASWPKLREFGGGGRYGPRDWLSFYLASMDRGFLQALIDGEIGRRMYEQDAFKFYLNKSHKLKATAQIYVNICSRAEFSAVQSSQAFATLNEAEKRKWAGWGLTPKELEQVLNHMDTYLGYESKDPTTQRLAKEVDALMVLKSGSKPTSHAQEVGRRYLSSRRSIEVIKEWVCKVRKNVLEVAQREMGPMQLTEPLPWCFQEVGFGQHGQARGTMHVFHDGTNYLFGLFTACAMTLYPKVFEIKTFAVMDVSRPEHADPCEILGSLCGGTYGQGEWMGLNPSWAGGVNLNGENGLLSEKLVKHFEKNQKDAGDSTIFEKNWREDQRVQERFDRVWNADLTRLDSETSDLEQKAGKTEKKLARANSVAEAAAKAQRLKDLVKGKGKR